MTHVVTVFFPPPRNPAWKFRRGNALYYLFHRVGIRYITLRNFGKYGCFPEARGGFVIKMTQKNYSVTSITLWDARQAQ